MNTRLLPVFLILLVCLPLLSTDIFIPALPTIARQYQTTAHSVNLTLTFYMMGFALSVLFSGSLSDWLTGVFVFLKISLGMIGS